MIPENLANRLQQYQSIDTTGFWSRGSIFLVRGDRSVVVRFIDANGMGAGTRFLTMDYDLWTSDINLSREIISRLKDMGFREMKGSVEAIKVR